MLMSGALTVHEYNNISNKLADILQTYITELKDRYPKAALATAEGGERWTRQQLQKSIGRKPLPLSPLDEAYYELLGIFSDPKFIDDATLEPILYEQNKAEDEWATRWAGISGKTDKGVETAVEYARRMASRNLTPLRLQRSHDVEELRVYFELPEQLLTAAGVKIYRNRGTPTAQTAEAKRAIDAYIRQHRENLLVHRPELTTFLYRWFGEINPLTKRELAAPPMSPILFKYLKPYGAQ